jgi:hypothetical protein
LNHFTQLELSDIERFFIPALQSLNLAGGGLGDREFEKALKIEYNLIVKGPEVVTAVLAASAFRVFSASVWGYFERVVRICGAICGAP